MAISTIIITINDEQWPKVHTTIERRIPGEAPAVTPLRDIYDVAHSQAECEVQNALRKAYDVMIRSRKQRS